MTREPRSKRRAIVLEFRRVTALIAGSLMAGLFSAIRSLVGNGSSGHR